MWDESPFHQGKEWGSCRHICTQSMKTHPLGDRIPSGSKYYFDIISEMSG